MKKAHNAGIKIVFATARPYRAIKHYMEQVGCSTAVYHNGAMAMVDGKRLITAIGFLLRKRYDGVARYIIEHILNLM